MRGNHQGADVLLDVRSLSKTFTATKALDDIDISIRPGEIVALCGQNGSGKSTLIKILAGFHDPDPGSTITIQGQPFDPRRSTTGRIHFIHQDLALVDTLSAIENLALSRHVSRPLLLPSQVRAETERTERVLRRLDVDVPLNVPVAQLTQAERTMIAIARAIDGWERDDNILVLDEPTASLHEGEARALFRAVRSLADKGAGVLFVSHRLDEVIALADRAVIFRDGRVVAALESDELEPDAIVSAMIGERPQPLERTRERSGEVVLSLRELAGERVNGVSLEVKAGEILGVSGLIGSGVETLGAIASGARHRSRGEVVLNGKPLPSGDISVSIRRGYAWAPAERQRIGAVMTQTIRENVSLPKLSPITGPFADVRVREERADVDRWIGKLQVTPADAELYMTQLSGGNQQKVVLAKWLRTDPSVLWLDEPTQGVDVGAKAAIHQLVADAASEGKAIVVASTDNSELVALCDRVLVMDAGRVVAELSGEQLTEEQLLTESIRQHGASAGPAARGEKTA
ncbi:sugar ABC transporter ATP-binding protein [Microbacterium schleiferi]|uniref:sugar ABC transporter ATP-binding protein n=1 Tax=Microbacterium schleiferi TaxID=69362 RepID=UPI001D172CE5|nr:sugar ABC transporter ATP-binding protein [Microbacterium schleiferi]MCC4266929.1 sugar ABC transporter ATP-binding protein [Microbacterium schleiferi]